MALETATYIDALVESNPVSGDQASTADDHIRLIKAAIKRTFPNVNSQVSASDGALSRVSDLTSSAQTQLDTLKTGKLDVSATAVYAQSAAGALSAQFATSATNATNAVSAQFATSATNATNAVSAQFATSATNATNAVNATNATSSVFATSATNATSAVFATSAMNATSAVYADSAGNATIAVFAGSANNATSAIRANSAVYATSAGYANSVAPIPIQTYTASLTFSLGDANQMALLTGDTDFNWTVPTNAAVAYPVETEIMVACQSAGQVTFVSATGVTIRSPSNLVTVQANGMAVLKKINTNVWMLGGALE